MDVETDEEIMPFAGEGHASLALCGGRKTLLLTEDIIHKNANQCFD